MKLKERLALIRAGYTKQEINDIIESENETDDNNANETEDNNENETSILQDEITKLKEQIQQMQKENIQNTEQSKPKNATSEDAWKEFFGEKKG